MKIKLNSRDITIEQTEISYEEIVELVHKGSKAIHSVTYSTGRNGKSGLLSPRKSVAVTEGMSFTAMVTGNA